MAIFQGESEPPILPYNLAFLSEGRYLLSFSESLLPFTGTLKLIVGIGFQAIAHPRRV